ncbi:heterokaryon incompatibility protein-domain-containing protein [Parachaetomium inaequale]|uniref:Heterokaryon incompatibility protein-domain-containing protein n=1 Tax=Parachaetomium inaequale TaxID=2588326 RepID=A0AAN6PQ08_9PEZI|nr:heterokaryon incompatibility protein-domain-containing protein [Parachaetomium inaequale]
MTQYRYVPLSGARQIRLLNLYAGAGPAELSVDLMHTSLDKAPCFTALSYPWGDPQPRKAIRCSGLRAEIGPSLHSALQHLRMPDHEIFVWADALCINQEDIPERTQQVRMMGDIYAAASTTAIWLGEGSDEVKMALGWLRRFDTVRVSPEFEPPASEDFGFISRDRAEKMLRAAFGKHRGAAFECIWALLDRPWFTRKWVIQELVKSRRPLLFVGRVTPLPWAMLAGWMDFVELCPAAKELFTRYCPRSHALEPGTKILGMNMRRATLLTKISATGNQILLFLVARTLAFRCGDPRDHIFTLVGIASDAARFNLNLIDYKSPPQDVWRQLAYDCVSDSMSLKLLWSLVLFTPLERRVHSWVPNLESLVAAGDGNILASQFTVQQVRDYNASGDCSVLQAHLDHGRKTLSIRGRILDRLQLLASDSRRFGSSDIIKATMDRNGHPSGESIQRMMRHRYQWLEECITIANTPGGSANGEEAFRDALFYDSLILKEVPLDLGVARSEFSTQMRFYKAWAYAADWLAAAALASMALESSLLLENLITERVQRRFGRTEKGRIGWLPPVAEEGDFICIFDGMELPYAIRPAADGRYLLVGECIIPGLMMGEAFLELPSGDSEMIVLE